ncbi:hypothetical protein GU927_015780 [Rhodobacteraceae bacterium HSP-20]|uniref:Uncharacterized protein n=1 Tax=Paragemmobacter amnigenus TaxID=2852097 RepID=A0ABS6J725_9RHOB|nr:hypothetical protein [Rhodobacter amnigenus]MBU9699307.1 hypothetical protein [Rhodobacter amnigenus]MBV4390534.1 hypothetical protein [Rhodobacter amnigenus]
MFIRAAGQKSARFPDGPHAAHPIDGHLALGCRTGRTFGPLRGRAIALSRIVSPSNRTPKKNCDVQVATVRLPEETCVTPAKTRA